MQWRTFTCWLTISVRTRGRRNLYQMLSTLWLKIANGGTKVHKSIRRLNTPITISVTCSISDYSRKLTLEPSVEIDLSIQKVFQPKCRHSWRLIMIQGNSTLTSNNWLNSAKSGKSRRWQLHRLGQQTTRACQLSTLLTQARSEKAYTELA